MKNIYILMLCLSVLMWTTVAYAQETLSISVTRCEASSPEDAVVEYEISTTGIDNPLSVAYEVTLSYPTTVSDNPVTESRTLYGTLTGEFSLNDLQPGGTTDFTLEVTAEIDGRTAPLEASVQSEVKTVPVPILIGTLPGHSWSANYGIEGTVFDADTFGRCYYYTTSFEGGEAAFRFISQYGKTSTDWNSVEKGLLYAPSEDRVVAPFGHWMPYVVYGGDSGNKWDNANAWTIPGYTRGDNSIYTVQFSFPKKSIVVVHQGVPTEVEPITVDLMEPDKASLVDVYSLQGIMLRKGVDSRDAVTGLMPGIYIVGGKKMFVM